VPVDASDLERIFREESGRVVATLVRLFGDIDLAEEMAQEAFLVASERWPADGLPPNPGGWLTTTARNRGIDRLRREASRNDRHAQSALLHEQTESFVVSWYATAGLFAEPRTEQTFGDPGEPAGTFNTFTVPGAYITAAYDISGGYVVGFLSDSKGAHGFIYSNGTFKDGKLSLTADFATHESIKFTGEIKDGKIVGEFFTEGTSGTWAASKV